MKNLNLITLAVIPALTLTACTNDGNYGEPVAQKSIGLVEKMPAMPQPYKMLDWKQKARDFDAYAFDMESKLPAGPVIWLDDSQRNLPQMAFGLYTAMKDARQGADHNGGEFHESLNSLTALLGAGLIGIDKTNQNGYNYVKMVQNYFNTENGWNIVMNNTCPKVALLGGGYGRDWWYDVFPNVLYYALCEVFPDVEFSDVIQKSIAEKFCAADSVLNGNYDYSYFDYAQMRGMVNNIPLQQDAAGGHGYVLYAAWKKYGDARYLEHAKSAIAALDSQKESRFYEILLPMGIYTAARLNAEQSQSYDIDKMLAWVFDGCTSPTGRTGWGITCGRWGDYDISGLQGSVIDGGGFAFLMNSIDMAMPLVPMVKYQPQYATAIGKWMLNNANSCRLFFPDQIPDTNQLLPGMQDYTNSIIAYEGLKYEDDYYDKSKKDIHPLALGDGPKWNEKNPPESMFSVYSTSAVGILGAIVDTTDVEGILRLDCNATDFYSDKKFPEYLCYNPFDAEKTFTYKAGAGKKDLFDIVARKYVAKNFEGKVNVDLPGNAAAVLVELPAGTVIKKDKQGRLVADDNIIAY